MEKMVIIIMEKFSQLEFLKTKENENPESQFLYNTINNVH
jgi:hypothetical protein